MANPNSALLESAVRLLAPLLDQLVFVGGCATGLLVTDPAAAPVRPTYDVDVITKVTSYVQYTQLSEQLRKLGLKEDQTEGAPTCRWKHGHLVIDVMPTDERILGFSNRWYEPAITTAETVPIAGLNVRVITAVYYLATKLEAFRGRGEEDFTGSPDLEDLIAVIDGRPELNDEIRRAPGDVRAYLAKQTGDLLEHSSFIDALPGFLLPDRASQQRLPLLRSRLVAIAKGR